MLRCSRLPWINGLKTQGIIITRRVSEGFRSTLVKRYSSIPHLRFGLGWSQMRNFKKREQGIVVKEHGNFDPSLTFRVAKIH
jgi:hypothetical protein